MKPPEWRHACAVASEAEGSNVVSQMWEGVARMTARARESTQSFLESSVLCTPPTAGGVLRVARPYTTSEIGLCLQFTACCSWCTSILLAAGWLICLDIFTQCALQRRTVYEGREVWLVTSCPPSMQAVRSSLPCLPGDGAALGAAQPPLNGVEWLAAEDSRAAAVAAAAADDGERVSVGEAATAVGAFELLDRDMLESATSVRNAPRPPPMHHEEFCSFLGPDGVPLPCAFALHTLKQGRVHAHTPRARKAFQGCLFH